MSGLSRTAADSADKGVMAESDPLSLHLNCGNDANWSATSCTFHDSSLSDLIQFSESFNVNAGNFGVFDSRGMKLSLGNNSTQEFFRADVGALFGFGPNLVYVNFLFYTLALAPDAFPPSFPSDVSGGIVVRQINSAGLSGFSQHANIGIDGLLLGSGTGDIHDATAGGSLVVFADNVDHRAFEIDAGANYNINIGSTGLATTPNLGFINNAGDTTFSIEGNTGNTVIAGTTTLAVSLTGLAVLTAGVVSATTSPTLTGLTITGYAGALSATAGVVSAGTLSIAYGGTNKTSWTANQVVYASADATPVLTQLINTASAVLINNASGVPSFSASTYTNWNTAYNHSQQASGYDHSATLNQPLLTSSDASFNKVRVTRAPGNPGSLTVDGDSQFTGFVKLGGNIVGSASFASFQGTIDATAGNHAGYVFQIDTTSVGAGTGSVIGTQYTMGEGGAVSSAIAIAQDVRTNVTGFAKAVSQSVLTNGVSANINTGLSAIANNSVANWGNRSIETGGGSVFLYSGGWTNPTFIGVTEEGALYNKGNVEIGSVLYTQRLRVANAGDGDVTAIFKYTATPIGVNFTEWQNASSAILVAINKDGWIGVGRTPVDDLDIYSAVNSATVTARVEAAGTNAIAELYLQGTGNTTACQVIMRDSDANKQWHIMNRASDSNNFKVAYYNGSVFIYPFTVTTTGDFTFGDGTAGKDYSFTVDGETNDGVYYWMEDEDYFKFSDDILMNSTEAIYFRDTAIHIASLDDGHLDLTADTSIDLNSAVLGSSTIEATTGFKCGGTAAVADGTYTVGARLTPVTGIDGTITVKGGIITAIQPAT